MSKKRPQQTKRRGEENVNCDVRMWRELREERRSVIVSMFRQDEIRLIRLKN